MRGLNCRVVCVAREREQARKPHIGRAFRNLLTVATVDDLMVVLVVMNNTP